MKNKKYIILLIIFIVLAFCPLFFKGIFIGHDISFHLSRIEGLTEGLKNGTFPVLIYPGYLNNYGYASGIFYPDFFLYFPAFLHLLGISTILSYKISLGIITILITLSMYFCIKKITHSQKSATLVTILYLMSSYRITDMWVRAAFGETMTIIFWPFVILGLYEIIYNNENNWKYLTIGLTGIVLSHLISILFAALTVIVFSLINIKRITANKSRLKNLIKAGIFSILITSFFTFPLIEIMQSDTFNYSTYSNGDLVTSRAVEPLYTILEIPSHKEPWIPQGIGIVFIYLFFKYSTKKQANNSFKTLCLLFGLTLLLASTTLFPWEILGKIIGIIQFPWRLYLPVTILFLFGFSENLEHSKNITIVFFALFTFLIGTYYTYRYDTTTKEYKYNIMAGEYIPVNIDTNEYYQRGEKITSNNNIEVEYTRKGTSFEINYKNNQNDNTYLELPLLYYKGYTANNNLKVEKGSNGMVRVYINNEFGNIKVKYDLTTVRKISYIISSSTLILFVALNIKKFSSKKQENQQTLQEL